MKRRIIFWCLSVVAGSVLSFSTACQPEPAPTPVTPSEAPTHGIVTETMEAGGYTYICLNSGKQSYWLASSPMEVEVGDEIQYEGAMLMNDFHSSGLDRTFPAILFVSKAWIRQKSVASEERSEGLPSGHPLIPGDRAGGTQSGSEPEPPVAVPELPGGHTVAEVFAGKSELEGKHVKVLGRVMKVNSNIMGLNWIHIQDGTGSNENNDLVVTSTQTISPGALIVVEGVVAINRTFQSGYFFPLILENALLSTSMASAHSE